MAKVLSLGVILSGLIVNTRIQILLKSGMLSVCLILGLSLRSSAVTIHVPADQPTIQAGIDAAVNGDTILVAPGDYTENIDFWGKSVKLISSGGAEVTTIIPANPDSVTITINSNEDTTTEIQGFTLTQSESVAMQIFSASPLIRNNIIRNNTGSVRIEGAGASPLITRNLFVQNFGLFAIEIYAGAATIINNTFDKNRGGIFANINVDSVIALNNTITRATAFGVRGPGFTVFDYNNLWEGNLYSDRSTPGQNDISVDPQYENPDSLDYRLRAGSPLIDAGNPDSQFDDPGGSRNDMGAFVSDRVLPVAVGVNFGNEDTTHMVSHTPSFIWSFFDTLGAQTAYEIEVGTDDEWSIAELWSSGEVVSSSQSVVYAGPTLEDDSTYFFRIHLQNDLIWGDWTRRSSFHMNSIPTAPTVRGPLGSAVIPIEFVLLNVNNSSDANDDSLTYGFEVYDDPGLTSLIEDVSGIPEQEDSTYALPLKNLGIGNQYWWRSRSNDGFENSEWSSVETFVSRAQVTIRIPLDLPTIQAGVDSSENGDTVSVAAGEYMESIDIVGKVVRLIGAGSDSTTLTRVAESPGQYIKIRGVPYGAVEVRGFTFTKSYTSVIEISRGPVLICENIFHQNALQHPDSGNPEVIRCGLDKDDTDPITGSIERNLFYDNMGVGCIVLHTVSSDILEIRNNTFDGNEGAISSRWRPGSPKVINNIITNSNTFGIACGQADCYPDMDYNNVYNNNKDYSFQVIRGPNQISLDPMFVDPTNGDYRLYGNSPAVDAGNPDPQYNDFDGSRNDIGAFALDCGADADCDYVSGADNCPTTFNPEQIDSDNDGAGDACDECTLVPGACTPCCSASGDADNGGDANVGDAIFIVRYIFQDGEAPACLDQADADGGGDVNIGDAIYIVKFIFEDGLSPVCGTTGL